MSNDENISKRMAYRTNEHPMKNFQFEFNQLRTGMLIEVIHQNY